ncbi:hypothetical protein HPP92_025516 [Vanilla planifolia]|uniref:Uncharacterized protein n=1 Tax=Vanilla planifolia TaxID=51239 RepID=A0A835U9Q1_VANPL|nr:hypothetical protein HPP92_025824 [Vanilla planifolia]KAG0454212.1 hypothetical protein HPP92_025516 [Vanilla planifolia]
MPATLPCSTSVTAGVASRPASDLACALLSPAPFPRLAALFLFPSRPRRRASHLSSLVASLSVSRPWSMVQPGGFIPSSQAAAPSPPPSPPPFPFLVAPYPPPIDVVAAMTNRGQLPEFG